MNDITFDEFASTAITSVKGVRCNQAWLGYGRVLFLGFSDVKIVPTEPRPQGGFFHPTCPAEIHTKFAYWELEHEQTILASAGSASAEALAPLVDRSVEDFLVSQRGQSQIIFPDNYVLFITPYSDPEWRSKDAWSVRTEDGYYSFLTCSGTAYKIHGTEPRS